LRGGAAAAGGGSRAQLSSSSRAEQPAAAAATAAGRPSSNCLFVNDMITIDQLQKDINTLKDEIEELERKNDNYEKQLNGRTSKGTVEWTTLTTWITLTTEHISGIQTEISEIEKQIALIAEREMMVLEVQRAQEVAMQAASEKGKGGGTIAVPNCRFSPLFNFHLILITSFSIINRPPFTSASVGDVLYQIFFKFFSTALQCPQAGSLAGTSMSPRVSSSSASNSECSVLESSNTESSYSSGLELKVWEAHAPHPGVEMEESEAPPRQTALAPVPTLRRRAKEKEFEGAGAHG